VKGFDLGNSPREYTPEAVRGRRLVFTTTNGTAAMVACRTARKVVVGAFLNMEAVLKHLTDEGGDVLVVPVGREGVPVLDDTVCGGLYVERLARVGATDLNGPAYFARMAHQGYAGRLLDAMRDSPSGKNLLRIGLGDDLPYCVQVGLLDVVPLVANGRILGQE
jgi:2-phosphosulfolactate phosphatase